MRIHIREMLPEDARAFLEVHHAAVRGLAAKHYPEEIIEAWAPPVSAEAIERLLANPDKETRFVAELNSQIVGIGVIIVGTSELRACYVAPTAARKGVGSALVRELEKTARAHGLSSLHLDASVNAEPFYQALGYAVQERRKHMLQSGHRMACVKMLKRL